MSEMRMSSPRCRLLPALFFCIWSLSSFLEAAPKSLTQLYSDQQSLRAGQELFARHCMGCHGIDAKGRGPAASMLFPKPRNLVEGAFKFRSTPLGSLPTRDDLLRTLQRGIAGTSMPSFKMFPTYQREALVDYVMSLRPNWKDNVGDVLSIPFPPAYFTSTKPGAKDIFLASALKGKKVFGELCSTCHGDKGLGDGPASVGLFDGDNQPIKPANLGARHLKSGSGSRDVFRTISTGLDGTPMPSFVDALSVDQRWEVVAFVYYLRGENEGLYSKGTLDQLEKVSKK